MEDQIIQYIQNVLQREPEPGEVEAWVTMVESGSVTIEQVRDRIVDSAEAQDDVYPVILAYQAIYGRVPDQEGLDYWVNVYRANQGLDDPTTPTINEAMVEVLSAFVSPDTPEFVDRFGENPTAGQFISAAYSNVLNREPDAEGLAYWTNRYNEVRAELKAANPDMSDEQINIEVRSMLLEQFVSSDEYRTSTEEAVEVFLQDAADETESYTGSLWERDPDYNVGETFTLTTGTDAGADFTGGDKDDTFQADVEGTALLPLQTLNNTDNLDGGGGWNTLNAQLVDFYTVPQGLTNIQEINLSGPPGLIGGILPFAELDLINANDVQEMGFSALDNFVLVSNVQTELTEINVRDSQNGVILQAFEETLTGDDDALDINLRNAQTFLELTHDNGLPEDEGYEELNIGSTGSSNYLELEGDAATPHTVNVTGDEDLEIETGVSGEGLSFDHLRMFSAVGLMAALEAEFSDAAVNDEGELLDVSLTGAQGNTIFDIGGPTAGNITVETFDGDDTLWIDDHEGNLSIDVGGGNNEVDIDSVDGDVTVAAGDGDDRVRLDADLFGTGDEGEGISLDLGGGNNTLALGEFNDPLVSFANADIQGVQTLAAESAVDVPGGIHAVADLDGLDGLENIVFEGDFEIDAGGSLTLDELPNALNMAFQSGGAVNGSLVLEDVEELSVNVGTEDNINQKFTFGGAGDIVADDLESLTVNLVNGADYTGPTTAASSAQSLESVTVTGNEDSVFSMHFAETATPDITTIDLGGLEGNASISINLDDGVADAEFDPITITMGSGNLDYDSDNTNSGEESPRETFVFTQDFGSADIYDFNNADDASGDLLDLSVFGLTSYSQLDVDTGGDWVITSSEFDGEIVLAGGVAGEGVGDFLVTNVII